MLRSLLISIVSVLGLSVSFSIAEAQNAPQSIPAQCLNMDLTPYSDQEGLDIHSGGVIHHFNVEVASTPEQREQGLMCRSGLKDDYGMLFEYGEAAERTFWMEDTIVGLDILYIAPDGHIVSIQPHAKALDRTPLPSNGAASAVLEINDGLSTRLGLKAGDSVDHPFFHKP